MDVIELNEAFAAQGLGVTRDHGLPDDAIRKSEWRAIAIGHPLGASGARLITTAMYQFRRSRIATEKRSRRSATIGLAFFGIVVFMV